MSQYRQWKVLGAMMVMITACATTYTGRKQLILMPASTMSEMGESAFTQLKQEGTVGTDRSTTQYVTCVAEAVLEAVPRRYDIEKSQWEVVVFEDKTANAFALPGGKIGVHTGILRIANTSDQLAAILGHEIAHVLLRHGNERASQSILAQSGLALGSIALGDMDQATRNAVVGSLGLGAQYGVLLPYSRKHESEADILGQDLMADAGFNPTGAVALWKRMAAASGGDQPPELLSTHPAHDTRIRQLEENLPGAMKRYDRARRRGERPSCRAVAPPSVAALSKRREAFR